jgi:Cof subfamily protein (haloacid dehalogenase superfamily)
MARIALVVSDVDGTLLTKTKVLTDRTVKAVHGLHEAGIGFTITSSRPTIGMRFLVEPLKITLPIGAFNGSATVDSQMRAIEQNVIPTSAVERSLEVLKEYGVDVWLFTADKWLTQNGEGKYVAKESRTIKSKPTIVSDFTPYLSSVCKLVGSSADYGLLARCEAAAQKALGADALAVRSQKYYLDITPPGFNKGTFVKSTAQRLGVSVDAVATIGDMQNDLSMFAISGLSFAMGNASDDVKQHAKRVTATNEEDGFAKAMETLLKENGAG